MHPSGIADYRCLKPIFALKADDVTNPLGKPACLQLFDKIHVVSLPGSADRRAYIAGHLQDAGITGFEFHDAFDPTHPEVLAHIEAGRVMKFPPCFRCGKTSCGKDDCNNVLIGPQIANFTTYLNLWKKIAATPQRALVMEDDVRLHPYWERVLDWLRGRVASGELLFSPEVPRLWRLGWALGNDHDGKTVPQAVDQIRMSGPCHSLTSAFAQKLLDRFRIIDTTSDVYMHSKAPEPGEAVTILPPIASDLSWSEGQFASLIHPKEIRTRYLNARGQPEAAAVNEQLVKHHHKHMFYRRILAVGHPRTGTGFCAALLRQMGLDVGHEKGGKDGLSSWMFAVDEDENPYHRDAISRSRKALYWEHLIHVVRDIETAAPSIMRENAHSEPSYAFRRKHLLAELNVDLDAYPTSLDRAVQSLTGWTRLILRMQPSHTFAIESGTDRLRRFLTDKGLIALPDDWVPDLSPVNANKLYRGKTYDLPVVGPQDWASLSPSSWAEVVWYCTTFDYRLPDRGPGQ